MLTGKNIYKSYGNLEVLKGVTLKIDKGEIVSIVGPSGSGKSTLLHILGTLDQADHGVVEFNDVVIRSKSELKILPAPWNKRLLNFIIDYVVLSLISGILIFAYFGRLVKFDEYFSFSSISLTCTLISVAAFLLYYVLLETLFGRTVSKYITGTKVIVRDNYTKPSFLKCLIRSIARIIPFGSLEGVSFFSKRPVGWHDLLAGTFVTDSQIQYQKYNQLSAKQMSEFRNKHVGFVFQFHHLLPEFSALENVCIPGWLAGRKKSEVENKAKELLEILGLKDRFDNKPNELSGGEQQRVAVARALINNPEIVFADEPTGNLDSANALELNQLFFELRDKFNQTFLIVTHNEELASLGDRILHMKDGKIV